MLESNLFNYLHKWHCILFLPQVSTSRIPLLFIILKALLCLRPLSILAGLWGSFCLTPPARPLRKAFYVVLLTLYPPTWLTYWQVPAYITLTLTSGLYALCFFVWALLPQPPTACFLFPSRMNSVITVPDSFHHHKSDGCLSSVFFQPKENLKQTKSNLSFNERYGFNDENIFPIHFRNYWKNNGHFFLWPHGCIPEARVTEIKSKERSG